MRMVRTVTRTTPIPVAAGTFEARRKHEGLKVTSDHSYEDGSFEASKI